VESTRFQGQSVTISIGLCAAGELTLDPDQLLKQADEALYEAKNEGKNRVVAR